jgi:hypothetical protein
MFCLRQIPVSSCDGFRSIESRPERCRLVAKATRRDFEAKRIDIAHAVDLYARYTEVGDTERFVTRALDGFPSLCCGVACLVLRDRLGGGRIINGSYRRYGHTFLLVDAMVIDITADQFGGPGVHVATMRWPWSTRRILHGFESVAYGLPEPSIAQQ